MLALRLQRTGRKKISHYRVIAQEHRFQPTSGKVIAYLGHYNPHTKEAKLETEQIQKYLDSGARPSDAAAKLFKAQGMKLPDWVSIHEYQDKKDAEPAEGKTDEPAEKAADEAAKSNEKADDKAEAKTDEEDTKKDKDAEAAKDKDDNPAEEDAEDAENKDSDDKAEKAEDDSDDSDDEEAKES